MSFVLFLIVSLGNFALGYFTAIWLGLASFGGTKTEVPSHPDPHQSHP